MQPYRIMIDPTYAAAVVAGSALATAILIWLLKPVLVRYAMARPNARSSHTIPTPQGGGIAIIVAVTTILASCAWHGLNGYLEPWVPALLVALFALALAGAIDDIRPQPVLPRLALQIAAAALLLQTLPGETRLLPVLLPAVETALLTLALVWFINLTNFMDGIDWITLAEFVPITLALAILGVLGIVPQLTVLAPVVLALLGAMIGFAPFNRHVARLFLGDVGSLPIGALVGWLLIILAMAGHWMAALILPLYYLADASMTLLRRLLAGENVAQAHRSHFYQRAVQNGFTVPQVTARVFATNVVLALLAVGTISAPRPQHRAVLLALAAFAVLSLLMSFNRGPRR